MSNCYRFACLLLVPVKANLYRSEIFANPGEDVFMACMVEGNPIIDAYWKDVHGRKVATNWQFEV